MTNKMVDVFAKILWEYHRKNDNLKKSDCILVLGGHDLRVAERGVELFLQKYAPIIVFSGNYGNLTKDWKKPEAEIFAEIAIKSGVHERNILIENQSRNTGENITFSKKLLTQKNIDAHKVIIVTKPYMERRAYATAMKVWPEIEWLLASPTLPFENYPTITITKERLINKMVGDLQRIKLYPQKGFQIYQKIPKDVWQAYEGLIELGYTKYLVRS